MSLAPGTVLCAYPAGGTAPVGSAGWAVRVLDSDTVMPDGWLFPPGRGHQEPVLASAGLILVLGSALGPGPASALSLMATGLEVMGGVELSDADGRPTGVVTGPRLLPAAGLDLSLIGLLLDVGGQQLATACGASAAGHPAAAAAAALSDWGVDQLGAGTMIFSGRWTAPVSVPPGSHLTASFGHLGSVTLRVSR